MNKFKHALVVSPLADGAHWVLIKPFSYDIGKYSDDIIDVKVGFETDFASVPRILWWLIPKWGRYGNAAVIHDWMYWDQNPKRPKRVADEIMLEAMEYLDVPFYQRYPIYWAVRLCGNWAWARNRKDKQEGVSRIHQNLNIGAALESDRPGLIKWGLQRMRNKESDGIQSTF